MNNPYRLSPDVFKNAATETEKFYLLKGYTVEDLPPEHLVQLQGTELECGDGRYGLIRGRKVNPALFGATWGVAAMHPAFSQKGISEDSINKTINMLVMKNLLPGIHGDTHEGILGCGLLGLLRKNLLKDVNNLNVKPERLIELISEFRMKQTFLPGNHQEQILRISFVPRYGPALDANAFRLTGDTALTLGIPLSAFNSVSEQAVSILTKGNVERVQIARP